MSPVAQALLIRRIALDAWMEAQCVIEPGRSDFEKALDTRLRSAEENGELDG